MKVLIIGWGLPPKTGGGLDVYCRYIAEELSKTDEVYLAIPSFNMPDDIPETGNACILPIDCEEKDDFLETVIGYNKKLADMLSKENFDIVHANDWFSVIAAERISEFSKTPWIFCVHSLEYIRNGFLKRVKGDIDFLEERALKNAFRIITVSDLMKDEIIRNYGIEKNRISVIRNGYNEQMKETKTSDPSSSDMIRNKYDINNEKIVLYVGRLSAQKGIEYLIRAAGYVLKDHPETKFLIAGFGYLENNLKKYAKVAGVEESIIFAGRFSENEKFALYSAGDVFVSPSLIEPFGITVTEAMSMRIPVISTRKTGGVESMKDGREFVSVREKDPMAIASSINKILSDRSFAEKIAKNGYDYCKNNFSWEKCAKETKKIYEKIL